MNIIAMLLIGIGLHELFSKDEEKPAQNLQETVENDSIKVENNIDANNGENSTKGDIDDDTPNTDGDSRRDDLRQVSKEISVIPAKPETENLSENSKKE